MSKEKRVGFEGNNSICAKCNIQIGIGNLFEWLPKKENELTYRMVHPSCRIGSTSHRALIMEQR